VSSALHPRTAGVLSSIEDVLRIVKGEDDGGFGVGRQGGNHAGGPSPDGHFRSSKIGAFLEVLAVRDTRMVFTEVERP
jgi:hypothetical protein